MISDEKLEKKKNPPAESKIVSSQTQLLSYLNAGPGFLRLSSCPDKYIAISCVIYVVVVLRIPPLNGKPSISAKRLFHAWQNTKKKKIKILSMNRLEPT